MNKLLVVCLLAGCGAMAPKTEDTLVDTIRGYNEDVRWSRFDVAANHIPVAQRSQYVDERDERAKDLKISDYEIVRVDKRGTREARAQIKVTWYKDSEGTVHETQAVQTWERTGKVWLMVDESRLRGTEMPGLPEPLVSDTQKDSQRPRGPSVR